MTPLEAVRHRVQQACVRANRDPLSVKIVAVTKLQPSEKIAALASQGQRIFGENYVQELTEKMSAFESRNLQWHLIGNLQRNKVKVVSGKCDLIHSVDSASLAENLDKRASENSIVENILLQVNVGGEESKEGLSAQKLREIWPDLARFNHLRIHGLMTMPPLQNNPEDNRAHFRALRELLAELVAMGTKGHPMNELSMGTSHDFEVAVEEGATLIRVGTVLFGDRPTA